MMKQREIKLFWKAKQNASTKLIYLVFIEALKSINISNLSIYQKMQMLFSWMEDELGRR